MANFHLKDSINHVLKKIYQKKGDVFCEIAINWSKIAGLEFARQTTPIGIKYYKTKDGDRTSLILNYTKSANTLELKFSEGIIIERINHYFGYNAVNILRFK